MDEEEDEKYHQAFKEAIQRAVEKRGLIETQNQEEEKKQHQEKTEKMLQNGLGYTEMVMGLGES